MQEGNQLNLRDQMRHEVIFVPSDDEKLATWASDIFDRRVRNINMASSCAVIDCTPVCFLFACDYRCSIEVCAIKFCLAANWASIPLVIARQPLLRRSVPLSPKYLVSLFRGGSIQFESMLRVKLKSSFQAQLGIISQPILRLPVTMRPIFIIQQRIIDARGKIKQVTKLKADDGVPISLLARNFKRLTGVTLKSFIDKIRLCHSLGDLLLTSKSIKCIALEFGYRPTSFSLRFHNAFQIWPSQVRSMSDLLIR